MAASFTPSLRGQRASWKHGACVWSQLPGSDSLDQTLRQFVPVADLLVFDRQLLKQLRLSFLIAFRFFPFFLFQRTNAFLRNSTSISDGSAFLVAGCSSSGFSAGSVAGWGALRDCVCTTRWGFGDPLFP